MPDQESPPDGSALSPPPGIPPAEEGVLPHGRDASSGVFDSESGACPPDADGEDRDAHGAGPPGQPFAALPPPPDDPELMALRQLVFKRELTLLEQLNARLADPNLHARDVSDVVAEALLLRARKDDKLARVLEPLVENIFKSALRKNRFSFADSLFPIMGPAIRRSIAETFRSMLESLNKSVEMSLSWQGLRWRVEGWRTGRPFSEIVLLHTLVYRVEQIFFIHGATGLVLAHVVDEGVVSQDADMVSAMFTAIQDFVRDSFTGAKEGSLEQLQFGEFTILVETSPLAYLACVVRGTPPMEFRRKLRSSLELLLVDSADALADYNGDSAPFASARRLLEDCLESHFVGEDKPLPLWIKALPVALLLCLIAGVGLWVHAGRQADRVAENARIAEERRVLVFRRAHEAIVDKLRKEPGILVISVACSDDQPWEITCLRDELARPVSTVIAEAGGQADDVTITEVPYEAFDPAIVTLRAQRLLRPPQSVRIEHTGNGGFTVSGAAPLQWILRAKQMARNVPGVREVIFDGLTDPRLDDLLTLARDVETSVVEFPLGKDMPMPADLPKLEKTVDTLIMLETLAGEMGISVSLTAYGYADASGNDKRNYELSQARGRSLAAMLYSRGSQLRIDVYGMGTEYARRFREKLSGELPARRLELRVHLDSRNPDLFELLQKE